MLLGRPGSTLQILYRDDHRNLLAGLHSHHAEDLEHSGLNDLRGQIGQGFDALGQPEEVEEVRRPFFRVYSPNLKELANPCSYRLGPITLGDPGISSDQIDDGKVRD